MAAARDAIADLGTVISRNGGLELPLPLDTLTELKDALDGILGPPQVPSQGPYLFTVSVEIEALPEEADSAEIGAAALLAVALADGGDPGNYRHTPHSVSCWPADQDPDAGRGDVWTATLQILAEYPDVKPVITGPLPGHVREIHVLNVE